MRWVYILESESGGDHWYVGMTDDFTARLAKHNSGSVPHTAKHRPWRLKTVVGFGDDEKAALFERYLKSGSGRAFARKKL